MATVLLTGASGFVGRQVHHQLASSGHDVRVVLRAGTAARLKLPVEARCLIETDNLFAQEAGWWKDACAGVDTVVHCAWHVEHGRYLDAPENAHCVTGTYALARGACDAGVSHFVGVGTCMEYRLPSDHLTVHSPLDPRNFYAACKLSAYYMLQQWLEFRGVPFSWCRIFYLYGEGEHPRRLASYVRQRLECDEIAQLSSGTQIRDFLDVREAAAMIAGVVKTRQAGAINICSGEPITIRAFVEQIADEYGKRHLLQFGIVPPHPSDPAAVVGVCNLIRPLN